MAADHKEKMESKGDMRPNRIPLLLKAAWPAALRQADIASYAGSTVSEIAFEFEHLSKELIRDLHLPNQTALRRRPHAPRST